MSKAAIPIMMAIAMAVMMIPGANAIEWQTTCLNDTYLYKWTDKWIDNDGDVIHIQLNETELCSYGCENTSILGDRAACNPPAFTRYAMLGGFIAIMLLSFFWIAKKKF